METQVAVDIGGDGPAGEAPPVGKRRRRRVRIAVLAVVVVIAGGLSWFLAYGATYQPLTPGDGYGDPTGALKMITDGLDDTAVIEVGGKGARGTFLTTLQNNGSHSVQILASPQQPSSQYWEGPRFYIQWEPAPDGGSPPAGTKPKAFPVTLAAGEQIWLSVTVVQPNCAPNSGSPITTDLRLRWSAFGWHHVYSYPIDGGSLTGPGVLPPIVNCPQKSALHYIDKNA